METIFMVVEVEEKGMFNDFLMGNPVIGNQYESGENNLVGGAKVLGIASICCI